MYPPYNPYPKDKPMPATNPNNCDNCDTCSHKQNPQGGWCYMFRDEPSAVCMIHSGRNDRAEVIKLVALLRSFKQDDIEKEEACPQ